LSVCQVSQISAPAFSSNPIQSSSVRFS